MDEALMQQVLSQLGGSGQPEGTVDPLMTALLGSLVQRQAERDDDDEDRVRAELARARRAIARLKDAVRAGDTMALYISQIFGCCQVCWGLNQLCATCRGEGGPGYREPDTERLLQWLAPALERRGLEVVPAETPRARGTTMDGRSDT